MVVAAALEQRQVALGRRLARLRRAGGHRVVELRRRGEAGGVLVDVVRRVEEVRDARPGELVEVVDRQRVAPVLLEQAGVELVEHVGRHRLALLDQAVRAQLEVGEHHLRVEGADDRVDRVLQQQEALLRVAGLRQQLVEQEALVGGRGHLGDEDRVVGGDEGLVLVRQHGVHRMAGLVRQRERGVERVVVVHQQVRADAVHAGVVGAAALAFVLVDVDPAAGDEALVAARVLLAERRHRLHRQLARLLVRDRSCRCGRSARSCRRGGRSRRPSSFLRSRA